MQYDGELAGDREEKRVTHRATRSGKQMGAA